MGYHQLLAPCAVHPALFFGCKPIPHSCKMTYCCFWHTSASQHIPFATSHLFTLGKYAPSGQDTLVGDVLFVFGAHIRPLTLSLLTPHLYTIWIRPLARRRWWATCCLCSEARTPDACRWATSGACTSPHLCGAGPRRRARRQPPALTTPPSHTFIATSWCLGAAPSALAHRSCTYWTRVPPR